MEESGGGGGKTWRMWQPHVCYLPAQSSLHQENVTVFGCLTHEVPLSLGDAAVTCSKGRVRNWGRRGAGRPGHG